MSSASKPFSKTVQCQFCFGDALGRVYSRSMDDDKVAYVYCGSEDCCPVTAIISVSYNISLIK